MATRRGFLRIASASAAGLAGLAFMPELTGGDVDDHGLENVVWGKVPHRRRQGRSGVHCQLRSAARQGVPAQQDSFRR